MDAHPDVRWPRERLVLSAVTARPKGPSVGLAWDWQQHSKAQKDGLNANPAGVPGTGEDGDALGKSRLAYLRGERSEEAPGGIFRRRASRHGDIVHSKPWYQDGKPGGSHRIGDYAAFRQQARRP